MLLPVVDFQPVLPVVVVRVADDGVDVVCRALADAALAHVFDEDGGAVDPVIIPLGDVVGRADPGEIELLEAVGFDLFHLGAGGVAYATGISTPVGTTWQIYRPGNALIDPETKATLGYEAIFLGTAQVRRAGDPATLEIITATQEISSGDRLIAAQSTPLKEYVPRAPSSAIRGHIIGMYGGIATGEAGKNSIVAINRGKRAGLEEGHVLAIARAGNAVSDPESTKSRDSAPTFKLPDERYGLLFVFRVFDAVSYALVMNSSRPVAPADIVQTP